MNPTMFHRVSGGVKRRPIIGGIVLLGLAVLPARAATLVAGTFEEGVSRLEQAISRASERGDFPLVQSLRLDLAKRYAGAQRYVEAARQYELVLASRPSRRQRVELFVALGRMRFALQDFNGAIGAFEDALHDDPHSWEAHFSLAQAYARVELNTRAIEEYQRCLALKPEALDAYEEMASIYQRLSYFDKAIACYEKVLQREARPESFLGLADCYVGEDDFGRATEILQRAKAVLPRADYDVQLGEVYRKRGYLAQAVSSWKEALQLDPGRDDVRLSLAVVEGQMRQFTDADRLYRRLLAAFPKSPLVHFCHAWALYDRGDRRAARMEALTVRALEPADMIKQYNERLLAQLQGA